MLMGCMLCVTIHSSSVWPFSSALHRALVKAKRRKTGDPSEVGTLEEQLTRSMSEGGCDVGGEGGCDVGVRRLWCGSEEVVVWE